MAKDAYLIANRLEDVIFLIQYLGLGKSYFITKGIPADGISPQSDTRSQGWENVAKQHREFFRLSDKDSISLTYRYHLRESGNPDRIDPELVQKLIQVAMSLHERQAKRVEVWRGQVTLLLAIVGAITGVVSLFLKR